MKRLLSLIFCISLFVCRAMANIGDFSITPYISEKYCGVDLHQTTAKLLNTKLIQIITGSNAHGGADNRFILTPHINVIAQETTASIPQKTVVKVEITFCVGDGISGTLFQSSVAEYSGVGDSTDEAISSAIAKIRPNDATFKSLIEKAKADIVSYYNTNGPSIVNQAKVLAANQNYEQAISYLMSIPNGCNYFDEAQRLLLQYGSQIITRDNNALLVKAKSAWAASPDYSGAEIASQYISQICITDSSTKNEVNQLIGQINKGLKSLQKMEYELAIREIESQEAIQTAEINASAQVATSFIESVSTVVYNIARWFIF